MKHKDSIVILIYSTHNKFALQLRAAHDDSYPLHWDFSVGGGIEKDEDPEEAAHREFYEELGVGGVLTFVEVVTYKDEHIEETMHVYKTIHNGPFKPNRKEVESVHFFTEAEIEQMIKKGEKFHPEFIFMWKNVKSLFPNESNFPKEVAAPAKRALSSIGVTNIEQITHHTEEEIINLHGMGPKAFNAIRKELESRHLSFKK